MTVAMVMTAQCSYPVHLNLPQWTIKQVTINFQATRYCVIPLPVPVLKMKLYCLKWEVYRTYVMSDTGV